MRCCYLLLVGIFWSSVLFANEPPVEDALTTAADERADTFATTSNATERPSGLVPLNEISWAPVFHPPHALEIQTKTNLVENAAYDHRDPYIGPQETMHAQWVADNLRHRTLYFEDLRLERHGKSHLPIVQPTISFIRFMGDAFFIPAKVLRNPFWQCHFTQCQGRAGTRIGR